MRKNVGLGISSVNNRAITKPDLTGLAALKQASQVQRHFRRKLKLMVLALIRSHLAECSLVILSLHVPQIRIITIGRLTAAMGLSSSVKMSTSASVATHVLAFILVTPGMDVRELLAAAVSMTAQQITRVAKE